MLIGDRIDRSAHVPRRRRARAESGHDASHDRQGVAVVASQVIGDAGFTGMQIPAAEILRGHDLAGSGFHEWRPAEEDRALVLHNHGFIAHRRNVSPTGSTGSEHRRDLCDAGRAHVRLVVEDAAEVVPVGEHLVLTREERAAGVHQVDTRQAVLRRDLLGAEVLLDRHRVIRSALDGGVVGHHHAFAAGHPADAGDDSGRGAVIVIHTVSRQWGDLQQRTAGIQQPVDTVPRQELAARSVPIPGSLRAPESSDGKLVAQLRNKLQMCFAVCGGRCH